MLRWQFRVDRKGHKECATVCLRQVVIRNISDYVCWPFVVVGKLDFNLAPLDLNLGCLVKSAFCAVGELEPDEGVRVRFVLSNKFDFFDFTVNEEV